MDMEKIKTALSGFYSRKKKWVWIGSGIAIVLLALAILLPQFIGGKEEEAQMTLAQVTVGEITESIDVVGTLEAQPMIELAWESSGIVSDFSVQIGDQVKKDDVLLSLEESSLSSAILQAQSDLLDAKAELDNLKSANSSLYTALQTLSDAEYTLKQYDSNRDYWNIKDSSWESIDAARSDYYAAKQVEFEKEKAYDALMNTDDEEAKTTAYTAYKESISAREEALRKLNNLLGTYYTYAADTDFILYDQAKAAVEAARIDYNRYLDQSDEIAAAESSVQALENTINQSRIIAPFDGTVTNITAIEGQMVNSGDAAVRLDNLENLVVKVSVSEVDINKVSLGQKAVVTFDAVPSAEYEGEVTSISAAGSDDSGVVEFSVTVKVLNANAQAKPGFTAVASIITSSNENALLVPNGAVISRNGNSIVMLVGADDSTRMVPVETGASSDTYTEIINGEVTEGDTVAVYTSDSSGNLFMMGGFGGMMGGGQGGGRPPEGERPQD